MCKGPEWGKSTVGLRTRGRTPWVRKSIRGLGLLPCGQDCAGRSRRAAARMLQLQVGPELRGCSLPREAPGNL